MKVKVNIPLRGTREYFGDYDEATIPNIGDDFGDVYVVTEKTIDGDICTLDVQRKDMN
jgi:hypothetical protein